MLSFKSWEKEKGEGREEEENESESGRRGKGNGSTPLMQNKVQLMQLMQLLQEARRCRQRGGRTISRSENKQTNKIGLREAATGEAEQKC